MKKKILLLSIALIGISEVHAQQSKNISLREDQAGSSVSTAGNSPIYLSKNEFRFFLELVWNDLSLPENRKRFNEEFIKYLGPNEHFPEIRLFDAIMSHVMPVFEERVNEDQIKAATLVLRDLHHSIVEKTNLFESGKN